MVELGMRFQAWRSDISDPGQISFADVENWELPPVKGNAVEIGVLPSPIWTSTKAKLIRNYLKLFLYITKHGVYIDGFAGPQDKKNPESWAAKLVLELQPSWMKFFYLCEKSKESYSLLEDMVVPHLGRPGRKIETHFGDFNRWVCSVLGAGIITEKTATFALLDQHSIECSWEAVERLARHKVSGKKIELFYFFPTGWIHRTIRGTYNEAALDEWWGDGSWRALVDTNQHGASMLAAERIQSLGYADVKCWPICSESEGKGRTMYHMIHATDHLEAPKLMYRAYKNLVCEVPEQEQIPLEFRDKSG